MATKNVEFWDNWQGFHKPIIYRAVVTVVVESHGRITTNDGVSIRIPIEGAIPVEA